MALALAALDQLGREHGRARGLLTDPLLGDMHPCARSAQSRGQLRRHPRVARRRYESIATREDRIRRPSSKRKLAKESASS